VNPSNADTRLAHLSALLLETYQLAREEPIERFHDTVLDCLTAALPFEKAWWGHAVVIDTQRRTRREGCACSGKSTASANSRASCTSTRSRSSATT